MDDALGAAAGSRRGERHELAHDVEEAKYVDGVALGQGLGGDVFGRLAAVVADVACGAGNQDVDFPYGLQDFGYAREVGL